MRRAVVAAPYVFAVVAFYCFWNAGSAERSDPLFTEEQMRLLAWSALLVAGLVAWWRPKTS